MASDRELKLKLVMALAEKVTKPLKKISEGSGKTAEAIKASRDELKHLERVQKDMRSFRDLRRQSAASRDALNEQRNAVKELTRKIEQADGPVKKLNRERDKAIRKAGELAKQYDTQRQQAQKLKTTLRQVHGVTGELAGTEQTLGKRIRAVNEQLDAQKRKLGQVADRRRRMADARGAFDNSMARAGAMQGAGFSAMATGAAASLPVLKFVTDFSSFEDAMLGVAKQVDGARDANGELTQSYYDIASGIKEIAERVPMATTELAKLAEGGARMGVEGMENILAFTETVAITATAFDLPADQLGEDMGKIANLYKIPIANIQALGDAINYLDDNAQSQGGDIIDVMKRVAGVAGTVNMSFRDASALGSSFLSLGAGREVAGTASSAMIRELAIAKMQPARFQEGLATIGMSADAIQAAMPKDATGTILKVLDAVNKLPDAKQLEVMTQLFGKEYGDDAAKLAKNVGEYRRQLELANSAASKGSMLREADARNAAISAQWQITLNHLFNKSSTLGALLKDTLIELLKSFNGLMESIGAFTKEHPEMVKWILKGVGAFAALVAVGGAITLMLGSLIGPIALVNIALAFLAANPVVLTIMAIVAAAAALAGAAYLIYRNWDKISAWFGDRWQDIKDAFSGGLGSVMKLLLNWNPIGLIYKAIVAGLEKLGIDVPAKFSTLGGAIVDGLIGGIGSLLGKARDMIVGLGSSIANWFKEALGINSPSKIFAGFGANLLEGLISGIDEKWQMLKDKISSVAGGVMSWFKDKLGINSPSRVFMGFGVNTLEGYQKGLAAKESGPLRQIGDFGKRMRQAGAGLAIGAASLPALADIPLDTRPPISAASGGGGPLIGELNINVHPSPGMDEQALARYVAAEVQRALASASHEAGAKRRSALYDID